MRSLLCAMSLLISVASLGVEESSVLDRYRLVGVISESNGGVAVIRDHVTKRSITIRSGQKLPGNKEWTVEKIQKRRIRLGAADRTLDLTYNTGQDEEESPSSHVETEVDGDIPLTRVSEPRQIPAVTDGNGNVFDEYMQDLIDERDARQRRLQRKSLLLNSLEAEYSPEGEDEELEFVGDTEDLEEIEDELMDLDPAQLEEDDFYFD